MTQNPYQSPAAEQRHKIERFVWFRFAWLYRAVVICLAIGEVALSSFFAIVDRYSWYDGLAPALIRNLYWFYILLVLANAACIVPLLCCAIYFAARRRFVDAGLDVIFALAVLIALILAVSTTPLVA